MLGMHGQRRMTLTTCFFGLVCVLVVTNLTCLGAGVPTSAKDNSVWTAEDEALARARLLDLDNVEYKTGSSSRYSSSTATSSSRASSASASFPSSSGQASSSNIQESRLMDKTEKAPADGSDGASIRRESGCRSCHLVHGHGGRKGRSLLSDVVMLTGGGGHTYPGSPGTATLVDVFDPLGECQVQLPQLLVGRYGHSSHYIDNKVYLCAGFHQGGCSHWVDGTFQHHSRLLEDRGAHSGVTMGKHIYLSGGEHPLKTSMETWSVGNATNTWISAPQMQQGRSYACSVATSDTTFIVIGGYGIDNLPPYHSYSIDSVEEFNTVTGTWRSRAAMPGGGREQHSCVNIGGGQVLVAGGTNVDRRRTDLFETPLLYDVDADQWRAASGMNKERRFGQLVVVNGKILYMGGKDEDRNVVDTIEEYDPEADSWTLLETRLNTPQWAFGASVLPRSLLGC